MARDELVSLSSSLTDSESHVAILSSNDLIILLQCSLRFAYFLSNEISFSRDRANMQQ